MLFYYYLYFQDIKSMAELQHFSIENLKEKPYKIKYRKQMRKLKNSYESTIESLLSTNKDTEEKNAISQLLKFEKESLIILSKSSIYTTIVPTPPDSPLNIILASPSPHYINDSDSNDYD